MTGLPLPSLTEWFRIDPAAASPVLVGAAMLLSALYLRGAIWLWSRGRRWSIPRTISFLLGCILLLAVGALGVNRYADVSITALVFQQITLMTVVPPLLITGSPGRLLLRSTPHSGVGRLVLRGAHAGLRARWTRALLHPVVPIAIALVFYPLLYLTDFISIATSTWVSTQLLLLMFLVAGLVSAVPLWSSDPLPREPSFPARIVDIIVEIQVHAILGLMMIQAGTPLFSAYATSVDGTDPLYDQAVAGALLWTYAEIPLLIVLIVCLSRWRSRDLRKAVLNQSREDAELESYNAYLAEMSRKQR